MPSLLAISEPRRQTGAARDCAQAPNALPWLIRMPAAARKPVDAAITVGRATMLGDPGPRVLTIGLAGPTRQYTPAATTPFSASSRCSRSGGYGYAAGAGPGWSCHTVTWVASRPAKATTTRPSAVLARPSAVTNQATPNAVPTTVSSALAGLATIVATASLTASPGQRLVRCVMTSRRRHRRGRFTW